jgi:predicted permease
VQDRILVIANGLVRFAHWLNWAVALGFVIAIVLSFVFGDAISTQISTKYHGRHVAETIALLRIAGLLGTVVCVAVYQLFSRRAIRSLLPMLIGYNGLAGRCSRFRCSIWLSARSCSRLIGSA